MESTLVSLFVCHASHAVLGVRVARVRTHDAYNASTLAIWVAMCGMVPLPTLCGGRLFCVLFIVPAQPFVQCVML